MLHHLRVLHRHALVVAVHVEHRVAMLGRFGWDVGVDRVAGDFDLGPVAGEVVVFHGKDFGEAWLTGYFLGYSVWCWFLHECRKLEILVQ